MTEYKCNDCGDKICGTDKQPPTMVFKSNINKPYYNCVYCDKREKYKTLTIDVKGITYTKLSRFYLKTLTFDSLLHMAKKLGYTKNMTNGSRIELVEYIHFGGHNDHKQKSSGDIIGYKHTVHALCYKCKKNKDLAYTKRTGKNLQPIFYNKAVYT